MTTTIAGTGAGGYSGDNGQATSASFYSPVGVAVDSSGKSRIVDTSILSIVIVLCFYRKFIHRRL